MWPTGGKGVSYRCVPLSYLWHMVPVKFVLTKGFKKEWMCQTYTDTHPVNSSSFVAANSNFYKAPYDCLVEEWHGAPSFQFMTRQPYQRQLFFGWYWLSLSPCSPLPCLFIFFRVGTSWRHRWRRRRTATIVILHLIVTFEFNVSVALVSVVVLIVIIIGVHVLGFESLLLELLFFFLGSLLLQQLRWTKHYAADARDAQSSNKAGVRLKHLTLPNTCSPDSHCIHLYPVDGPQVASSSSHISRVGDQTTILGLHVSTCIPRTTQSTSSLSAATFRHITILQLSSAVYKTSNSIYLYTVTCTWCKCEFRNNDSKMLTTEHIYITTKTCMVQYCDNSLTANASEAVKQHFVTNHKLP